MSGGISSIAPIAGAAAGFLMGGGLPGAALGMQLGGAAGGLTGGGSNGQLGSPRQAQQVVGGGDNNPFDEAYGPKEPTGNMPSNIQNMNLPTKTEVPGSANKSATNTGLGYASTAMQALAAAQSAQQQKEIVEAEIAARKWRNPTIVSGPSGINPSTSMGGGFPSIGGGFMKY